MGYSISVIDTQFRIQKEYLPDVLQDLKGAAVKLGEGQCWGWCDMTALREAKTLREGMLACRWDLEFDDLGNVNGILFEGEKLGDEEQIFDAIATLVLDGNFIELMGEDGERWRWVFRNGSMDTVDAEIVWPEE